MNAVIQYPYGWLLRAKRRALSVLPLTKDAHPAVWGFSTRLYHQKTIAYLETLGDVSPDGEDWWKWIIYSTRLEATCDELGIAALERKNDA